MPTTPLFPKDNAPITINQGKTTGNCYLLASISAILNSGTIGQKHIRSLFTETDKGVSVRIQKSSISRYLQVDKLQGKYEYESTTNVANRFVGSSTEFVAAFVGIQAEDSGLRKVQRMVFSFEFSLNLE